LRVNRAHPQQAEKDEHTFQPIVHTEVMIG